MFDSSDCLRWACEVEAAPGDKSFSLLDWPVTGWTLSSDVIVKIEWLAFGATFLGDDFDDRWDDFAGFFNDYCVIDTDVFTVDFVLIVERGTRNGGA